MIFKFQEYYWRSRNLNEAIQFKMTLERVNFIGYKTILVAKVIHPNHIVPIIFKGIFWYPEVAFQKCSKEKLLWKYAANLQENTHAEVWFQ